MLPLNPSVDFSQIVYELFLLVVFAEDGGHLLLEGANDVGMDLKAAQESGVNWCV